MKGDTGGMERRINEISTKRMTMIVQERQKLWNIKTVVVEQALVPDWNHARVFVSKGEVIQKRGETLNEVSQEMSIKKLRQWALGIFSNSTVDKNLGLYSDS